MTLLRHTLHDVETHNNNIDKQTEIDALREFPWVDSPLYPRMLQEIINKYEARAVSLLPIKN